LRRKLLEQALPMIAAGGALEIVGPEAVPVRIELRLTISAIEFSGPVANEAKARVESLLDPATGGHDGLGWWLGDVPSDTDIAAALAGIKHLESVDDIAILRADDRSRPGALTARQLVQLAPEGVVVNVAVEASEVFA
jgi:hypothetical protein